MPNRNTMKKIVLGVISLFILGTSVAFALPISRSEQNLLPFVDNTYYLGSTTPSNLRWKAIFLGTGTSTSAGGFNLTSGCFAINNVCIYSFLNPMTNAGDIIYGGAGGTPTRLGIGGANTVLHGGAPAPSYSAVVEDDISLSNVSTNNATIARHGFLPILSNNASQYLNGQGNFAIPSGTAASYTTQTFTNQTSVNVIHNFGTYPVVAVLDSNGVTMIPMGITNNTLNDFTVTFSVSTSGTIIASVGSPQPQQVIVVNSDYTILITDRIIKETAAAKTITLPTAVGNTGREFVINNASSGNITVDTTCSQTKGGSLTQTLPSQSSMTVYSDGANYQII